MTDTDSDTVRIGVIGAGGIFRRRHFPALTGFDDATVVAVANRSAESARAIADEFDIEADCGADPAAVIERDDVDAVMIGTYPHKHCPYGTAALEAGKHTFVQARMATSLREAKELHATAEETGLVTQICPSPFGMRGDAYVRRLIDDGHVGDVKFVRAHVTDWRDDEDPLGWRDRERYQGVNALAVGILAERLHRWVGRAETVSALTATAVEERPLSGDGDGDETETGRVDLPDVVAVNCRLRDGGVASYDFSERAAHSPANRVEIYGTEGTLRYDLDDDILYAGRTDEEELSERPIPDDEAVEWSVERDFVDACRAGSGSPRTTFREGVDYMTFSEAVMRSAETGSDVRLPLRT
jgi:predicted dehydrogenase